MRVREPTAVCDHCTDVKRGPLWHGSTCQRCESGRYVNQAYEPERPFTDEEAARA